MLKVTKKIKKAIFFCSLIGACLFYYGKYFLLNEQIVVAKQQATPSAIKLTESELEWLEQHEPIRIAFDGDFPPYSFKNEFGKVEGISHDIIQLISQKFDIQFEVNHRAEWEDIYRAALDKKIDVIATMVNRPNREFQFLFTRPYIFKSLVIVTHEHNEELKLRSQLAGKTVALVNGFQYSEIILKENPSITPFYVDTMHDALVAVEKRQVDAAISYFLATSYIQNKYLLSGIKVAAYYNKNSANESLAIRKDLPVLAAILQKGLESVTEAELQSINGKWSQLAKNPVNYEVIGQVINVFAVILIVLLLWIGQVKYQARKLKITKNKLVVTNYELNDLKENLEQQVIERTKQLKESEQKYKSLVENLKGEYFFYKYDVNGVFTYLSPSFSNILGFSMEEGLKSYSSFLSDHDDNKRVDEYTKISLQGGKSPAYEIEAVDKKGEKHRLSILAAPFYDDNGNCIGVEGLAHDITKVRRIQEQLNWLSYYDELTGLANRRLFKEKFEQLIALSERHKQPLALLFLDLDRFKVINDSLGHTVGDEVLIETAKRLKAELRGSDVSARMGGDEFTVILLDADVTAAENVVQKILESFQAPYKALEGSSFTVGASIGISIYPQDSQDANGLLQLADIAMYSAKKTKSGYAFSSSILDKTVVEN